MFGFWHDVTNPNDEVVRETPAGVQVRKKEKW